MNNPIQSSNRRRQSLVVAGFVAVIIYIIVGSHCLKGKDGLGGYWWMYLSPLALWLIIAGTMFARKKMNSLYIVMIASFSSILGGVVAIFTLLLVNDFAVSKREGMKLAVKEISCRHFNKKGVSCTVYFLDKDGNEYDAGMSDYWATPFQYLDSATIEVSTGVLGGRFIDIAQFAGTRFREEADRKRKREGK